MVKATEVRLAALDDPDVAMVALAYHLARQLDSGDPKAGATAATAKEYRATMTALLVDARAEEQSLDDLDDEVSGGV